MSGWLLDQPLSFEGAQLPSVFRWKRTRLVELTLHAELLCLCLGALTQFYSAIDDYLVQ